MTLRLAELCAGYGGLGLALHQAGIPTRLDWYAEIDGPAATVMAHHHPHAPNLGDLCAITDPPPADIITAGFPCQPVSTSGRREGVNDERWIIRDVVAVWRRSGARWLILENVPGLLSANEGEAFGQVIDALAEVGASAEWTHLRASDVGAPHRRNRWFCVAWNPEGSGWDAASFAGPGEHRRPKGAAGGPDRSTGPRPIVELLPTPRATRGGSSTEICDLLPTPAAADGTGGRRATNLEWKGGTAYRPSGAKASVSLQEALDANFGKYAAAVERWEHLTRPAPNPTIDGRLSPAFVEWMMGLDEGHVTGHELKRADQLRILGNGVVPQQAAVALAHLLAVDLGSVAA